MITRAGEKYTVANELCWNAWDCTEVTVAGMYTNFKDVAPEKALEEIDDTEYGMLMLVAVLQAVAEYKVAHAKEEGALVGWRVEPGAATMVGTDVGTGENTFVQPVTAEFWKAFTLNCGEG